MNLAQNRGTTVSATAYEANNEIATASANAENRNLLTPYRNVTGKNTTTVVSVEARTGRATSRPPCSAATAGSSPISKCRYMFSSTTTELSMSREKANAKPPRTMLLMELPPNESAIMVASAESGIEKN